MNGSSLREGNDEPFKIRQKTRLGFKETRNFIQNTINFMSSITENKDQYAYFSALGRSFHIVANPLLVEEILLKKQAAFNKGPVLKRMPEVFGDGVLTAEGDIWKNSRKRLNPAFNKQVIPIYQAALQDAASAIYQQFKMQGQNDLLNLSREATLRVLLTIFFGEKFKPEQAVDQRLIEDFEAINRYFEFLISGPGQILGRVPSLKRFRYLKAIKKIDDRLNAAIKNRYHQEQVQEPNSQEPLQRLINIAIEQHCSPKNIRDDLMTLLIAGHETSAMSLAFCLLELKNNPDLVPLICHDSAQLGYFLKEVLRIYPPVWTIARSASENIMLTDQFLIKKDEIILIPLHTIQRNKMYYEKPLQIDLSRWENEKKEASQRPRSAYMPFGIGPRMCLGADFALLELEILLKPWLENFDSWELSLTEWPLKLSPSLTLKPNENIKIFKKHLTD